jgi:hypothetical protein
MAVHKPTRVMTTIHMLASRSESGSREGADYDPSGPYTLNGAVLATVLDVAGGPDAPQCTDCLDLASMQTFPVDSRTLNYEHREAEGVWNVRPSEVWRGRPLILLRSHRA